jgi:PPOX class probable FMN-dependent enzyme
VSELITDVAPDLALDDLKSVYPDPLPRTIAKALPTLDEHATQFIRMSPFCVFATSGPDGTVDASPRGGNPGFVHIASATELMMPDRVGNNRIDSVRNMLSGTGYVQLIFFVPGIDETLRVGGKASLSTDAALLASLEEFGKLPRAVIKIAVHETYFHCGKSLMRAKFWSKDSQIERSTFPSISQIVHAQTKMGTPDTQAEVEARNKTQL